MYTFPTVQKHSTEKKKLITEDIKYLLSEIEKIHRDPYKNVTKQKFESALNEVLNKSPIKLGIQEALALLKDAHTKVVGIGKELFAIEYTYIGNSLYIIGISKEKEEFLGQKVISVSTVPIAEINEKLEKLSSKENQEVTLRDTALFLQSNMILKYFGISDSNTLDIETSKGNFQIAVGDKESFQHMKVLNPLIWKEKDYINNPTYTGNSTYRLRVDANKLLFQYNACNNRGYTPKVLENFQQILLLEAKQAKNIIVDLRLNSGGSTNIMAETFKKFPDDVPIHVAIGRKTYSSAIQHLLYLKTNKNATLVGENAGQKPNKFGDRKDILLPNSAIKISCSYKYFELLPDQDIDVIKPDISIPITIESYINSIDPLNAWIKSNL